MLSSVVLFPQSASTASSPPKQVLLASPKTALCPHITRCIPLHYGLLQPCINIYIGGAAALYIATPNFYIASPNLALCST